MTNESANPTEATPMYPLARDANGNPLDVPAEAVAWRVRKLARKAGRPKVLFDAETGLPRELPLTSGYDDFIDQVNESGRFRLEPVDGHGRIIPGCVAVTEVVFDDDEEEAARPKQAAESAPELMRLVAELVESNAQVMRAMASAFGQVQPSRPFVIERSSEEKSVGGESQIGQIVATLLQKFASEPGKPTEHAVPAPSGVAS